MKLSHKIESTAESQTAAMTPLIDRLRQAGRAIIDLAVGEPHFATPAPVIEATKNALDARRTRYGPVNGLTELRSRLAAHFNGYGAENILVTNGSKQALFMIFQALCNPGDEVIIPIPFWVSFVEQVKLAGGTPVFVHTQKYQLDSDAVQQAITPRTKAILINSPNNPSGAVYPLKELRSIARLAAEHDLFIVADEAYESFVYDGEEHISLHEIETGRERTIVTRSFSKTYGMTGFRIGYVAATAPVIAALSRIQSHLSGNVCTFAQYGALGIPSLDDDWLMARQAEMQRKRDIAFSYASRIFKCMKPKGAFYLFPDVSAVLKPGQTARDLADHLLTEAGVAVVPGEAFGMPEHLRISFAVSEEHLTDGLERITEAL